MRHKAAGMLLLCALVPAAEPAHAQDPACLAQAYSAYAAAQRHYQDQVARLVTAEEPAFSELAGLARQHQLSVIDAREYALLQRLRSDAGTLHLNRPINQWLDWSAQYRERLIASDPEYARLVRRSEAFEGQLRGHPDWTDVHSAVRRIAQRPAHAAAVERLHTVMHEQSGRCTRESTTN